MGAVSTTKTFTQAAHGLSERAPVYFDGTWVAAQADAEATLAEGIVVDAPDADTVTIYLLNGVFFTSTGHGVGNAGDHIWTSAASAGALTTTEPSGDTEIVQPLGQVIDANTLALQNWSAEGPL